MVYSFWWKQTRIEVALMSTRKPNRINQHEPLRVPQGWNDQSKALVMQIDRLMDDIYNRLGKLEEAVARLAEHDQ